MTTTLLGISFAYVVVSVLLLAASLFAPIRWWVKAPAIVVASFFFVEEFYASKGLMGWPGTDRLPNRFQLLWTRVVEPDPKLHDPGSIFFWVEEVDENNVPVGVPRSYRLAYTKPLADKSLKARDEIMSGNPQEGTADDMADNNKSNLPMSGNLPTNIDNTNQQQTDTSNYDPAYFKFLTDQPQDFTFKSMPAPLLPAKN
jgi:hypothetical protein